MVYKLADLAVEISTVYPETEAFCRKYLCESDRIDFSVCTTAEDIAKERQLSEEESSGIRITDASLEQLALYREICAEILRFDAFMMHGAVIEYEGKGYLFTAKSGTGKTTHIRLWQKLFGENKVTIVNGDKPIIRFVDGKVYAYGTPWCGKEGYNTNTRVELNAICFLERGLDNSICEISDTEALPRLFSQIMVHDSADLAKQLELVDRLFEKVPTYLLKCNMDVQAAKVALNGMSKTGKENECN